MNARMDTYRRMRPEETLNAWNETVTAWQDAGDVRAAVSDGGGALQELNMLYRIESTHTAVTWDDVRAGERLLAEDGAEYRVEYAIPGGRRRMAQLFLKRTDQREVLTAQAQDEVQDAPETSGPASAEDAGRMKRTDQREEGD